MSKTVSKKSKVRRFVLMFQPRFSFLVESGAKCQTIRKPRKRMPVVGDLLSLRAWCGKAYRSEQRELAAARVTKVQRIMITFDGVMIAAAWLKKEEIADLAWADGFASVDEFFAFFRDPGGRAFSGFVFHWEWEAAQG